MRLGPCLLSVLALLRPACGQCAELGITAGTSAGSTFMAWTLGLQDMKVVAAWRDGAGVFPSLEVETPWLAAGPLQPAGLAREVLDPLGFSAGSAVFTERTGLSLDPSGSPCPFSLVFTPVPGSLGFYAVPVMDGCPAFGSFVSVAPTSWLGMEAEVQGEDLPPGRAPQEWFPQRPPFPGGQLLQAAGRIQVRLSSFAACGSFGSSFAQWAPPGCFFHVEAEYARGPLSASLFVGAAGDSYRTPAGHTAGAQSRVSARIGLEGPRARADLAWTLDVQRPGFLPSACRAETETLAADYERSFALSRGVTGTVRLEARKLIGFSDKALRREDPSASISLVTDAGPLRGQCDASWSRTRGLAMCGRFVAAPTEALRVELEGGTDGAIVGLTVRHRKDREIAVKAGMWGGKLSFALSWKAEEGEAGPSAPGP